MQKTFEEICTDITTIFIALDLPRPYIHPLTNGILISIGEDSFHENVFPVPTRLFSLLDDCIGGNGVITITNNSLGDLFLPNLNITYNEIWG